MELTRTAAGTADPQGRRVRIRKIGRKPWQKPLFIGIDVAKDTFHVASCPASINISLPNNSTGTKQLIKTLQPHNISLIVLEATGGYERPIVAELLEANFKVVVASPRQVRDFARGIGEFAKTDPIDAACPRPFRPGRSAKAKTARQPSNRRIGRPGASPQTAHRPAHPGIESKPDSSFIPRFVKASAK